MADDHPFRPGELVVVSMRISRNRPLIEGRAIIRGTARGSHRYWVQFLCDPVLRERVVHPDPQQNLAHLADRQRFCADECENFADFFPDNFPD